MAWHEQINLFEFLLILLGVGILIVALDAIFPGMADGVLAFFGGIVDIVGRAFESAKGLF